MPKLSALLLLVGACGAVQAQSTVADNPAVPASAGQADSPVEREAALRGAPAANADQDIRPGNPNYSNRYPNVTAECGPTSVHCPIAEPNHSRGSSVISTDSLPIGSAGSIERGAGGPTESQYPTTQGSGSMGSGVTGSTTGPAPGPTNGIGR